MGRVALEVVRDLTGALHSKLQRLPISYYDQEQTGRLMARITSDVGSLLIFLNSASLQLVCDLILAAGISVTLLVLEWRLALIAFATLGVSRAGVQSLTACAGGGTRGRRESAPRPTAPALAAVVPPLMFGLNSKVK